MSMRRRAEIIGRLDYEKFARVFSGLRGSGAGESLTRSEGNVPSVPGFRVPRVPGSQVPDLAYFQVPS